VIERQRRGTDVPSPETARASAPPSSLVFIDERARVQIRERVLLVQIRLLCSI
jgi:hypothetical protein